MSAPPVCGGQQPSPVPKSLSDWWVFTAIPIIAGGLTAILGIAGAVAGAFQVIFGSILAPLGVLSAALIASCVAGAAAIGVLLVYYALKPDGCIRSLPDNVPICCSGFVQDTSDLSSTAMDIFAPFAMGPSGQFDLIVQSKYWNYVTQNAIWVLCNPAGAAMLRCMIKSQTACGAKIGSLVGAIPGAAVGVVLGYFAGVATGAALQAAGCAATGPFFLLCALVALIVAAVVAAACTYLGAMIGGWIGEGIAAGIAAAQGDPVGSAWEQLNQGSVVTVNGNWATDSDSNTGWNYLFYTTGINRMGSVPIAAPPGYVTTDVDNYFMTMPDDCPLVPQTPQ